MAKEQFTLDDLKLESFSLGSLSAAQETCTTAFCQTEEWQGCTTIGGVTPEHCTVEGTGPYYGCTCETVYNCQC